MAEIKSAAGMSVDGTPIVVIGAGAAGLCAALSAAKAGADVVVLERDPVPTGSTGLSAGLIPAAGTRFQRAKGIADQPRLLFDDIERKTSGEIDPDVALAVCEASAATVEW